MSLNISPRGAENFSTRARSKRLVDFASAALALPLTLPLLLVIGIAIRLTSKGPAIIRLSCIGMNGKTFRQYRFRVVRADAAPGFYTGRVSALRNSQTAPGYDALQDRLTVLGGWLLRTGLNRLPQLFNVLKGDMSLIGPSAAPVARARSDSQPDSRLLALRPGIISPDLFLPAGRKLGETERMALSLAYAADASPRIDGRIILHSASRLWRGRNRQQNR